MMKKISWVIVVGSFLLFQAHSAMAWVNISGNWSGILWSIMFELSALYFWATNNNKLGVMASIVVLFMASYNITKDARIAFNTVDKVNSSERVLNVLVDTLDSIKGRTYPLTIKKTIQAITDLKSKEITIKKGTTETSLIVGVVLQFIALCFVLIAQIKAILFLRDEKKVTPIEYVDTNDKKSVTVNSNIVIDTSKADLAKRVLISLREFRTDKKLTSDRSVTRVLLLDTPDIDRLRKVVTTGKGMSIDKMNRILEAVRNYKEII